MDTPPPLILVVEDDTDIAASMKQALDGAGFSAMIVPGVREAVFKMKNQRFSCIILDLMLGKENGADLVDLARGKRDLSNLETPILVVSANLSKEVLQRLAGKVQGAMVKPFALDNFLAQVKGLAK